MLQTWSEPLLKIREKIFALLNPPNQNQPIQINIASWYCFPNARSGDPKKWEALFKNVDVRIYMDGSLYVRRTKQPLDGV